MRRRAQTAASAWTLTAALIVTLASPAAAGPYRRGEYVSVQGRVTDLDGTPQAGVTVLFEPSRRAFRLSKMFKPKHQREQTNRLQLPTVTGADGSYSFEWRWDPFYNTFELAIAVPVGFGADQQYEILHRTEFSDRMMAGSPVEVALEVEDTSRLASPGASSRRWTPPVSGDRPAATAESPRPPARAGDSAEASTEDERRILAEMGHPDRVDSHQRLAGTETSWWYFEDGKVYHFLDGELSQVTHFDPIPPPEE